MIKTFKQFSFDLIKTNEASWEEITKLQRAAGIKPSFNPNSSDEKKSLEEVRKRFKSFQMVQVNIDGRLVAAEYEGCYNKNGNPLVSVKFDNKEYWFLPDEVNDIDPNSQLGKHEDEKRNRFIEGQKVSFYHYGETLEGVFSCFNKTKAEIIYNNKEYFVELYNIKSIEDDELEELKEKLRIGNILAENIKNKFKIGDEIGFTIDGKKYSGQLNNFIISTSKLPKVIIYSDITRYLNNFVEPENVDLEINSKLQDLRNQYKIKDEIRFKLNDKILTGEYHGCINDDGIKVNIKYWRNRSQNKIVVKYEDLKPNKKSRTKIEED